VLKVKLLDSKPIFTNNKDNKKSKTLSIYEIKEAIESLNLEYKQINEIDIYNIFQFIKESKKR